MRSHWETSEKSIYVRTVWINGVRHAILSKNDPLLNGASVPKRPYSCGNIGLTVRKHKKRLSSNYNRSISISTSSNVSTGIDTGVDIESPSDIEYEYHIDAGLLSDDEIESEDKVKIQSDHKKVKYKKIKLPNLNAKTGNYSTSEIQTQNYNNYLQKNNFINPITERVLNWLDLASKETNYDSLGAHDDNSVGNEIEKDVLNSDENEVMRRVTDAINNSDRHEVNNIGSEQTSGIHERNRYHSTWTGQDVTNRYQESSRKYETSRRYQDTTEASWRVPPDRNNNVAAQQNNKHRHVNESKTSNMDTRHPHHKESPTFDTQPGTRLLSTTNSATSNIMFNFQTLTNGTKNCTDKSNINKIRQNNEAIRRNNEHITRLANNIDQFKKTNEIVAHTFRHSKENHDKINNMDNANNVNKSNNNSDSNNSSELRTKSRHKKGHRRSKSHRKHSSGNDDGKHLEQSEDEYPSDEDINDTFRYVIMTRKENESSNVSSLNQHNEYGNSAMNRYQEITMNTNEITSRESRYASVLNEINRSSTNNYEVGRKYPKIDDVPNRRNEPYLVSQQPLYQPSHGRPVTSSKPQLHIFMPRFQNIS